MSSSTDPAQLDLRLQRLLARVANGDRQAFASLYEATSGAVFAVLRRMLYSEEAAEDALQEVFVSVWLRAADYAAERGRVLTWIKSIARYRAIDLLRKSGRERPMLEGELDALQADSPAPSGDEPKLLRCLAQLEGSQQQSLRLAYEGGYSHSEIARSLAMPLGTVKSWIRRGLDALKRCMER